MADKSKDTQPEDKETAEKHVVDLMGEAPGQNSEEKTDQATTQPPVADAKKADVPPVRSNPARKVLQKFSRKQLIIGAAVLLVAVAGAAVWFVFMKPSPTSDNQVSQTKQQLLGANASVVDGTAELSSDQKTWQALKADTDLEQGTYIRTGADGRVVVTLDDGSAVRVNSSSTVRLASLDANSVIIRNLAGEVYTRVVKSDRTFSVTVGDESYVALGTAYKTINTDTSKGVEVFQSEVSVKLAKQTVAEGKRFFKENAAADLKEKVTDIPLDQLSKDAFLQWNLEHDKKSSEFKDKLGYLEKMAAAPAPAPAPAPAGATTGITLSGSASSTGVNLSWKVTGVSVTNGFKVLASKESTPTYGGKTTESAYVKDSASRSYAYKNTSGKTYYFRVCVYTGDSCTNNSNIIKVTTPYVAPTPPSGTLSLAQNGGTDSFTITLNGSAPYGLKLVWAPSGEPTYPGSSAKYFDGASTSNAVTDADSGTYNFRVCMYYEGSCVNYSNQITATIP